MAKYNDSYTPFANRDFKQFYDPDYGTCAATENSDGSWNVTLNGNMTGYTDDFNSKFEIKKFTVTAKVSSNGDFRVSVTEVD